MDNLLRWIKYFKFTEKPSHFTNYGLILQMYAHQLQICEQSQHMKLLHVMPTAEELETITYTCEFYVYQNNDQPSIYWQTKLKNECICDSHLKALILWAVGRDESILLLFSLIFLSGNSFF